MSLQAAVSGHDSDSGGAALDVMAKLAVSVDANTRELAAARSARDQSRQWQVIHPFKVQLPSLAANGTVNYPDQAGPQSGFVWDVHKVIVGPAMTAGSISMFSQGGGFQEYVFTSAGLLTYGKNQLPLWGNDWLIFVVTGLTGTVNIYLGGLEMEAWYYPEYAS
jgi:hypothetical protein